VSILERDCAGGSSSVVGVEPSNLSPLIDFGGYRELTARIRFQPERESVRKWSRRRRDDGTVGASLLRSRGGVGIFLVTQPEASTEPVTGALTGAGANGTGAKLLRC
jgi:hypothetical protein